MQQYWNKLPKKNLSEVSCLNQFSHKGHSHTILHRSSSGLFFLTSFHKSTPEQLEMGLWHYILESDDFAAQSIDQAWTLLKHLPASVEKCNVLDLAFVDDRDFQTEQKLQVFLLESHREPKKAILTSVEYTFSETCFDLVQVNTCKRFVKREWGALSVQLQWVYDERNSQLKELQGVWYKIKSLFRQRGQPGHFIWIVPTAAEQKTKRGRPLGTRDSSKRSRSHNISKEAKLKGELCLIKILILEQEFHKWKIDETVCHLFAMTEGFNAWYLEKGSDSLSKKLNDWLKTIKFIMRHSFFLLMSKTPPPIQVAETKKHLELWVATGAQPNFFVGDSEHSFLPAEQTLVWYREHKGRLMTHGKQKIEMIRKKKSTSWYTAEQVLMRPSCAKHIYHHLTFQHHQLDMIRQDLLQQASGGAASHIENLFSDFKLTLHALISFAELMEMLISVLHNMRTKHSALHVNFEEWAKRRSAKITTTTQWTEDTAAHVQSIQTTVFPVMYEKTWAMAYNRLQSAFPPHVFAAIQDFVQSGNHYPFLVAKMLQ